MELRGGYQSYKQYEEIHVWKCFILLLWRNSNSVLWLTTQLSERALFFLKQCEKVKVKVAQSCPTLWDHYIVHGILPARILEWAAFSFSRGSSQARDQTQVSHIAGGFFTSWATREAQQCDNIPLNNYMLSMVK